MPGRTRSQSSIPRGFEFRFEPLPSLVVFDLDDTLCDHDGSLWIRLDFSFAEVFPDEGERQKVVQHSIQHSAWGTDHFPDVFASFGVTDGDAIRNATERYRSDRYRGLELFNDAVPALERVREIGPVGLITNGPTDIQQPKIDLLGIESHFNFVLISESVGIWKPDPEIFWMGLEIAGVDPEDAIYVGDSPTADVPGARAAGMTAVWMNRAGSEWAGETEPDLEVRDLSELLIALSIEEAR